MSALHPNVQPSSWNRQEEVGLNPERETFAEATITLIHTTVKGHINDFLFNSEGPGLIGVGKLKYIPALAIAEMVLAFRGLTITANQSRITTGIMNIDHELIKPYTSYKTQLIVIIEKM